MTDTPRHNILLACDQHDICRKVLCSLEGAGFEVICVSDVSNMFMIMEETEISIILLDLSLLRIGNGPSFAGESAPGDSFSFAILRDCCGTIELKRDRFKGNMELIFSRESEIGDLTEKIRSILKKLDPFIYKKRKIIEIDSGPYLREIVGNSKKIRKVYDFIRKVSKKRIDVLVMGETGTGKELVPKIIHDMSQNINHAFVAVNCAAIPSTLIESELFGHEKGAFTGAIERRIGKFELADGGTLFLDEIGDMSHHTQAKLLRAIESKEFCRLGGSEIIHSDVRIISATNKDLYEEVRKGNFRQDLYYRLNVDSITLPALRERKEDIPLLIDHFIKLYSRNISSVRHISPEALNILLRYSWPGNVRELKNCVQRAILYSSHEMILPEHLPPYIEKFENHGNSHSLAESLEDVVNRYQASELPDNILKEIEERLIPNILKVTGWNQKMTARKLGISINTLKNRIKDYNLLRN